MGDISKKNNLCLAFLGGFIVSISIFLTEFGTLFNSKISYEPIIILSNLAVCFIWFGFTFLNKKHLKTLKVFSCSFLICIVVINVLLSIYIIRTIWFSGYLTLRPVRNVVDAVQHRDTFSHASMAGGYSSYGFASYMVNSVSVVNYHTFSHLIVGIISKIFCIPTFIVYNFFLPSIFCPLYVFLIIGACTIFKKLFSKGYLSIIDFFCIAAFIIGFFPKDLLEHEGIWKRSWLISESFLVANCIFLAYLLPLASAFTDREKYRRRIVLYELVFNPIFIIVLCFTKISVGVLLAAGWMFYFFKFHTKSLKSWLFIFYYFIAFIIGCLSIISWSSEGGTHGIMPFAFVRKYCQSGFYSIFFSYGLNFIAVIIVLLYRFYIEKPTLKELFFTKKCWMEQVLIVLCFVSVLPGILFDIEGGSAGYFSMVPELLGLLLLIGYDIPDMLFKKTKSSYGDSVIFYSVTSIVVLSMLGNVKPIKTFKDYVSDVVFKEDGVKLALKNRDVNESIFSILLKKMKEPYVDTTFYKNVSEINQITRFKKNEYALFIDESAELWQIYKNRGVSSILVYPSITNLLCLNEMYVENDVAYNRAGIELAKKERGGDWILIGLCHIDKRKKELNEVLSELPANIKNVIVLENDTYRIIPVRK